MFILQLAILIYSVILHEIAHGYVADRLGDPTARLSGRLTLDPRPHIDPIMTIALPLLLIFTGSPVIFGAAKPVPIDPFNFREPKKDTALTAAAGPVTNLLIALFFAIIVRLLSSLSPDLLPAIIINLGIYAIEINVFLAIFNLLPIPPLDGFKVVGGLIPEEYIGFWNSLERFGLAFIFVILFFLNSVVSGIILPISRTILRLLLP